MSAKGGSGQTQHKRDMRSKSERERVSFASINLGKEQLNWHESIRKSSDDSGSEVTPMAETCQQITEVDDCHVIYPDP